MAQDDLGGLKEDLLLGKLEREGRAKEDERKKKEKQKKQ